MPANVETMMAVVQDGVKDRGIPWHGVGTFLPDVATAAQALKAGGLNWKVEKQPVFTLVDGKYVPVPDKFAIVRDSDEKALGIVGGNYVPLQNDEAFTFADNLVDESGAKYETAGSLRGGRWVWMTMKMPASIMIGGEDRHDLFLLITNSHDGSRAITAATVFIRVVCENTQNLALAGAERKWAIRHISTLKGRLDEARTTLDMTFKYTEVFQAEMEKLLAQKFTEKKFRDVVDIILPDKPKKPETVDLMTAVFLHSPTIEGSAIAGTKLGAYNAIGEYFEWVKENRTPEAQLMNNWVGAGIRARDKAFQLLSA
jgi:phage/plasmid-like protein (TIGR03299 family)